jgi:hypothetical protein
VNPGGASPRRRTARCSSASAGHRGQPGVSRIPPVFRPVCAPSACRSPHGRLP